MTFEQMDTNSKSIYLVGQMALIKDLIEKHKEEKFKSTDEVIGELHLSFIDAFNMTHALQGSDDRLTLGDLLQ